MVRATGDSRVGVEGGRREVCNEVVVKSTSPTRSCLGRLLLQIAVRRRRDGCGPIHGQLAMGVEPASACSSAPCNSTSCLRSWRGGIMEKGGDETHELFEEGGGVIRPYW